MSFIENIHGANDSLSNHYELFPVIYRPFKEKVHYTKSISSYNELCIVLYFAVYKIFPVANSP